MALYMHVFVYMAGCVDRYVTNDGPGLHTSLLWKVGLHVQSEDQRGFIWAESSLFS